MFNHSFLEKFENTVADYCKEQKYNFTLSRNEIEQLSWYVGNANITPESRSDNQVITLPFDVVRGLARRNSFELILREDRQAAHKQFVQAQVDGPELSFEDFNKLADEACS